MPSVPASRGRPASWRSEPSPALRSVPAAGLRQQAAGPAAPEVVVLPMHRAEQDRPWLSDADTLLLASYGVDAGRRLRRADATGAAGETVLIDLERQRPEAAVLAGVGDESPAALRRAGAAVGRRLRGRRTAASLVTAGLGPGAAGAFAEGLLLGSAPSAGRRSRRASGGGRRRIELAATAGEAAGIATAAAIAAGVWLARDLGRTGSQLKSPAWLARQAVTAAQAAGLTTQTWTRERLLAEGFGGLLGVASGSARPPLLVQLEYAPPGARRHVVLVGKGITFDSGGLSLKPAEAMTAMKTDMAGAAAVIGAMSVLPAVCPDLPVRVTAVLPMAENMPGAAALRPGDVLRHPDGRTTEVFNTDAEGRLILADALAYAATLRPSVVVDLATLTGAATLALGRGRAALFATTDRLATALTTAGDEAGEAVWRLPLVADYAQALHSDVADLAHVSRDPTVGAGAITAALYLRHFAGRQPWAHLDIAGPARSDSDAGELPRGATGFGTRLLLRWLAAGAPA